MEANFRAVSNKTNCSKKSRERYGGTKTDEPEGVTAGPDSRYCSTQRTRAPCLSGPDKGPSRFAAFDVPT